MSVGISITLNSADARRKIARLINLIDVGELLQAIGNRHVKWMVENLRVAGLDAKHQEMAASTIAARPHRTSSSHFSSRYRSRLQQSFVARVLGRSAVSAGTEDEYAPYHHLGTGPYTIRPRGKGFLRFTGSDGKPVFTKQVNHPGIPSRPLIPTKMTAERLAHDILDGAIRRKIGEAGLA